MATSKSKSKIMRDHEVQIELIRAFSKDPELKYYMGVAAGAGVTWVSQMLGDMMPEGTPVPNKPSTGMTAGLTWLMGPLNPALVQTMWDKIQSGGNTDQNITNILGLVGGGFAGFCAACLILRSMSGGQEGGLLSGII